MDFDPQIEEFRAAPDDLDLDGHRARRGEFHRVAAEILQHVEQHARIGQDVGRRFRVQADAKAHALLVRLDRQQARRLVSMANRSMRSGASSLGPISSRETVSSASIWRIMIPPAPLRVFAISRCSSSSAVF